MSDIERKDAQIRKLQEEKAQLENDYQLLQEMFTKISSSNMSLQLQNQQLLEIIQNLSFTLSSTRQ